MISTICNPNNNVNYRVGRRLGRGGNALCYELYDDETNQRWAGKLFSPEILCNPQKQQSFERECDIMETVQSSEQNVVVGIHDHFLAKLGWGVIIMDCVPHGSLRELIKRRGKLPEAEVRYWLQQVIQGVDYLHGTCRIMHRDLKPGNLLIDEDSTTGRLELRICDFGLSTRSFRSTHNCGTPNYVAPEVLTCEFNDGVNPKYYYRHVDKWAIGALAYHMLVGKAPFDRGSLKPTHEAILSCDFSMPDFISQDGQDFISGLLKLDWKTRLTFRQMRMHPWFMQHQVPEILTREALTDARSQSTHEQPSITVGTSTPCELFQHE
jgi:serine/threonine protein kinase